MIYILTTFLLIISLISQPVFAEDVITTKDDSVLSAELIDAITQDMLAPPADLLLAPSDAEVTYSGLATKIISVGSGTDKPKTFDKVKIHYTGWTQDGKIYDSSVERGHPSNFKILDLTGSWQEAIIKMKAGERRRLWVPQKLSKSHNSKVPDGMLVFDILLLEIIPEEITFQ